MCLFFFLVILNDNQMSIGHNTGGLATYFAKIWATKTYLGMRERSKRFLERFSWLWEWQRWSRSSFGLHLGLHFLLERISVSQLQGGLDLMGREGSQGALSSPRERSGTLRIVRCVALRPEL